MAPSTATSTPPSPTNPTAPPRAGAHKGHGQWALGHLEPLTPNERIKKDDDGLNVRARIENVYAHHGFESIDPADLRGRFRWWGLYTQRRPGVDGGKTAVLEPHELDDEYFMLRVRIDGGRLSTSQLRVVGEISQEFARDTADITDRQNVQLHWVRIEDVPEIWRRLEAVGLSTTEACGDTPRVVLGSPVAGIAADEIIDGTPAIDAIQRRFIGSPEFSNLPRKFKSAVSGSQLQDVEHEVNDISFVGVEHPEHGPGFDLWVGGGLSTTPMLARRLGAWVPLDEVPDVWAGVAGLFRDYGYRRLRTRARIKFLVADWGVERFREVLEQEYLGRRLVDGPPPPVPSAARDHVGVHRQADGSYYVGLAPTVGRVSGTTLVRLADVAEAHGSTRVRTTPHQKVIVLDVPPDRVEPLVDAAEGLGLRARPGAFRRGTMACTGIEFCKLAIVETKARAAKLIDELESRLPGFDVPLTVNVNGCPNSCARIQVADIGLKGQLVPGPDGRQVEGFQVHLGGGLGLDAGFGRKLRGHQVTADDLPAYVERVVRRFAAERGPDERFAQWVARADEESLR
jgi:sulfite reductase (ferredoxin)